MRPAPLRPDAGLLAGLIMTIESTYRLQFHAGFTFQDAAQIVPYLARLGITHVYASPYLQAAAGSTHGYDVVDHNRLNPELGTEQDFEAFLAALQRDGMEHLLDIVPNHVGVATHENAWWNDVLMHGPASQYAACFDIAWDDSPRPQLRGKILLPVLGAPYGQVLEKGELRVEAVASDQLPIAGDAQTHHGQRPVPLLAVRYYDRLFPLDPRTTEGIDPATVNGTPGDARSFDALHDLLERQHYRLAYWRTASDEINYRRFFDINSLAALAMKREAVFQQAHALVFRLLREDKLAGLRIDHPDGLYDPKQYFQRLQDAWRQQDAARQQAADREPAHKPATPRPLYVLAEKILALDEPLPTDWPIAGTSGYDALNMINGLFVDPAGEAAFTELYRAFTGFDATFDELVYEKKLLILDRALASELTRLAHQLDHLAQRHRQWRDFTLAGLREGLRQVIACFPVYRTYVDAAGASPTDRRQMARAVEAATARNPHIEPVLFQFIHDAAMQIYPEGASADDQAAQLRFAGRFQQLTAPVTAKGVEDTAFYCYHRLVSLNEVGGEPARFGMQPDALHAWFAQRQRDWPKAMTTLSTHDTKRSEDVRARLNVLSELPGEWRQQVLNWQRINAPLRDQAAPAPDEEYLLYQTLLGAWPIEPLAGPARPAFIERIQQYMTKAMREAKLRTSWTTPNEAHEAAAMRFIEQVISSQAFIDAFAPFQRRIAQLGAINSLAQTLLKLTAPGVPDTYQGTELWDLSLVDPDNRRPVDYGLRQRLVASIESASPAELMRSWPDGRVKLWVTMRALHTRRERSPLFIEGGYEPLAAQGEKARHVFAFARRLGESTAVVIIPRLVSGVVAGWGNTTLKLPAGRGWREVLAGQHIDRDTVELASLLADLPVALLVAN